jgi:UDP-N-acetylmuramate--alanine ligase
MYQKKYQIHFVGIGGIGMSGIAELLLNLGYRVSGSDIRLTAITSHLEKLGGTVFEGHLPSHVNNADVVVTSSAVEDDNPEVKAARNASIPVIPRAEMLAELMRLKYSIAIAGAHGKTSTTSIIADLLAGGGLDPTIVIGGKLKSIGANARLGQGAFIVAEADESDGSFLRFSPTIAVVTNIDLEHLDFYKDLDDIKRVFVSFIDRIPFYGLAVLCLDSEPVQDIIPEIKKRFTTYGLSTQADFQANNITFKEMKSRFEVHHLGTRLGTINLNLPGLHSVYNAMAAIAVGTELGISFAAIRKILGSVAGVQRRLEIKGKKKGITVVDDYGHHPTEIKATLQACLTCWPDRRKIVVFQPHRHSRTLSLFDDFTRAFYHSDTLRVLPIYAAGEKNIPGVNAEKLCTEIRAHGHKDTEYVENMEDCVKALKKILTTGDILLTLGAGNVWQVGERVLEDL